MSERKHTPGEWFTVDAANDGGGVYAKDDSRISGRRSVASAHGQDDMKESAANRKLIAAAPDLLAACEAMEAFFKERDESDAFRGDDAVAKIRNEYHKERRAILQAAIAKATGVTNAN
jgi:hypothetical protein